MKRSTLYAGAVLACALGLSACGGSSGDLPLTVQLGGSTWDLMVGTKKKTWRLPYTPLAFEAGVGLSFTGSSAADGDHGPVVSAIVLCAKAAGTTGKCPTP